MSRARAGAPSVLVASLGLALAVSFAVGACGEAASESPPCVPGSAYDACAPAAEDASVEAQAPDVVDVAVDASPDAVDDGAASTPKDAGEAGVCRSDGPCTRDDECCEYCHEMDHCH